MKLGLFGGSFDPIHNGHLKVARCALGHGLDRVVLIPARRSPHKDERDVIDPFHRFALVALAAVEWDGLRVSSYEMMRDGPSYTIDTVRHFLAGGHRVTLIMGSDSLAEIATWRSCRELLDSVGVLAYPRDPFIGAPLRSGLPEWVQERILEAPPSEGKISLLSEEPADVSSTMVRGFLQEGRSIEGLVPDTVRRFILGNGLYVQEEKHD